MWVCGRATHGAGQGSLTYAGSTLLHAAPAVGVCYRRASVPSNEAAAESDVEPQEPQSVHAGIGEDHDDQNDHGSMPGPRCHGQISSAMLTR